MKKLSISGIGCILMDYVYNGVSFSGNAIQPFLSKKNGDGGISPGKLVFTEELEKFSGLHYLDLLGQITGGMEAQAQTIGGPGVVSMIHLAQLLEDTADVRFEGAIGYDNTGDEIIKLIEKTCLSPQYLSRFEKPSAFTHVLSDPSYDGGRGERSFINNIGAAGLLETPSDAFFESDICVFGGTALVPQIHDRLGEFLRRAKDSGAFTIVNTVYDFRNQKRYPGKSWPLVETDGDFEKIDMLIMDREEALSISGKQDSRESMEFFRQKGVQGIIITSGTEDIQTYAAGESYHESGLQYFAVTDTISREIKELNIEGDTTGCGDNFAGGVIYAIAKSMMVGNKRLEMAELVNWGRASGGFACYYLGGTYYENEAGEKKKKVASHLSS